MIISIIKENEEREKQILIINYTKEQDKKSLPSFSFCNRYYVYRRTFLIECMLNYLYYLLFFILYEREIIYDQISINYRNE
jgi:hypothetical protein